ncbi:TetR/AcrR family transcriptional regulator [Maridesulfovibrio sp.]|uniref:TetR/AcrR family transcriptional regulator n=1 Tax=Maridesulfovibrio sp. TaxID=2795000 RepID=UPI0029F5A2A2|nr:TetR/AcrR family transcriptional regulator [Maridesulfovibrio sp.]
MKKYSEKETRILDTAAEMFANQAFHKVLLSDVAHSARVGKGTLYLYFKNKDDLYFAVLFRGFSILVDKLRTYTDQKDLAPTEKMVSIIREMSSYMFMKATNAHLLSRVMHFPEGGEWQDIRIELWGIIQTVIEEGVEAGEFEDSCPRFTSQYIPSFIRSISIFPPEGLDHEEFCEHACHFVLKALKPENK